jgi:D-3-phosphoglycerate dehydrogenase / 2-oxoglutarate reductase
MKNKILIGPSTFAALDSSPADKLINAGFEVVNNPFGRRLTLKELINLLPGVTGIIAGLEPLDAEVLKKSKLKVISRCGAGMSNVNQVEAKKLGIKVFSTPDAPTAAVAELTIGVMLSLLRLIPEMNKHLQEGNWEKRVGFQLKGKTLAIIGFGRIGQQVASLLAPFCCRILVVDPFLKSISEELQHVSLENALRNADIITLHCSGEECIIGESEFELMKRGTFLLNAARGGLINEAALRKALDDEVVAGAWLDVFQKEPYKGPLCEYKNVILTPHVGSYTRECRLRMEMEAVENLLTGLRK